MQVNEVFESIQGEGVFIGYPVLFIRLTGCNLNCWFCDTKYARSEGKKYSVRKLVKIIQNSAYDHVVFTGGEPMLQQVDIRKVMRACPGTFFEIETNGTIEPNVVPSLMTVSPKYPFDVSPAYFVQDLTIVFKFVIDKVEDLLIVDKFVRSHLLRRVILMPQAITVEEHNRKLPMLFEWTKMHHEYRISPRLQILAYGNKRGV